MMAAWWFPRFVLQALSLQKSAVPVVVLDAVASSEGGRGDAVIVEVCPLAEKRQVYVGMTVSQAQARSPTLRVVYRDEVAEQKMQHEILISAESWTPSYESTKPGLCVLDLHDVRSYGVSWQDRAEQMQRDLRAQGWETRVGIAKKPDMAILAARIANPVQVLRSNVQQEQEALNSLPIAILNPSPAIREVLTQWGVHTLGQLTVLPKEGLVRRLGKEGLGLIELAQGGRDRLLKLVRPGLVYVEEMELEAPIECLEPLMILLTQMLQRLLTNLAGSWLVAGRLSLGLSFANQTFKQVELRVAEPTRDLVVLLRILEGFLEGVKAPAPLIKVSLQILPTKAGAAQESLFESVWRDPNRFAETLSALEAILGAGRLGRAIKLPRRQPDSFYMQPFLEAPKASHLNEREFYYGLPLRRFRPLQKANVSVRDRTPWKLGEAQLTEQQGPWRCSGGWWDPSQQWRHEVWRVADETGQFYRLIHQPNGWFVEGVYA